MQPASLRELESELERLYRNQIAVYRRLLKLTGDLPTSLWSLHDEQALALISEAMDSIAQLDAEVMPWREEWKRQGGYPNGTLAETLKEVEELIVELMKRIDGAEKLACEAKAKLAPQMSAETRRQKMAIAYQAGRQSS